MDDQRTDRESGMTHAEICEPTDTALVDRFKTFLNERGAKLQSHNWAIGVDMWEYRIGNETLTVFADTWSIDIEGSAELVARIQNAMQEK
jgi:hypothetical protein